MQKITERSVEKNKKLIKLYRNIVLLIIFIFGYVFSYINSSFLPINELGGSFINENRWFGADIFRIVTSETNREHVAHHRTSVHPFFSIVTYPIARFFSVCLGVSGSKSVVIAHSIYAGLLLALIFALIKNLTNSKALPFALTLLAASSSCYIFFTAIPESFVLGAISIGIALWFHEKRFSHSNFSWVVANLVSLGMTITNYSISIISMIMCLKPLVIIKIVFITMLIAVAIGLMQREIFPKSGFLQKSPERELGYVNLTNLTHAQLLYKIINRGSVFLSTGFVMTGIEAEKLRLNSNLIFASHRSVLERSPGYLAFSALVGWWVLLLFAIINAFININKRDVLTLALIFYISQFGLHLIYGDETFIYTLNSLPAVVVLLAGLAEKLNEKLYSVGIFLLVAISAYINYSAFIFISKSMSG